MPSRRPQSELYEAGIAALHARRFADALALFEQAEGGPSREMAHSARLHAVMCRRRLMQDGQPSLQTPEERYDYAVALINARRISEAERHLREAIAQAPGADHLYYALALCRGLSGDLSDARAMLKRAIELNPRNRLAARNDPDFAEIAQLSPLAELLYSESTGA